MFCSTFFTCPSLPRFYPSFSPSLHLLSTCSLGPFCSLFPSLSFPLPSLSWTGLSCLDVSWFSPQAFEQLEVNTLETDHLFWAGGDACFCSGQHIFTAPPKAAVSNGLLRPVHSHCYFYYCFRESKREGERGRARERELCDPPFPILAFLSQ